MSGATSEHTVYRSLDDGDGWFEAEVLARSAVSPEGVCITEVRRHTVDTLVLHERRHVEVLRCAGDDGPEQAFRAWLDRRGPAPSRGECAQLAARARAVAAGLAPLVDEAARLHQELDHRFSGRPDDELDAQWRAGGLAEVDEVLTGMVEQLRRATEGQGR